MTKDPEMVALLGAALVPRMPYTGDGIVEKDIDGKYIYNYLHCPEGNIIVPRYYSSCESFIQEFIEFCEEQIEMNTLYKVIDKYYYLLRFAKAKLDNPKYIHVEDLI